MQRKKKSAGNNQVKKTQMEIHFIKADFQSFVKDHDRD